MSSDESSAKSGEAATKVSPVTVKTYRVRTIVLKRVTYLVVLIMFACAAFYPYGITRKKGANEMRDLVTEQLRQGTRTAGTILMNHYEHVITMTRTIANMRPFFNCTDENMKWLVRWIRNFQNLTQLHPLTFHVGELGKQACHFMYDETFTDYRFLFSYPEGDVWHIYEYPVDVELDPFNRNDPRRKLIGDVPSSVIDETHTDMNVTTTADVGWTYTFPFEPNLTERPVFTCYTRGLSADLTNYDGWVALSMPVEQYSELLDPVPVLTKGRLMLCDKNGSVVYEGTIGTTRPDYIEGQGYVYPNYRELDFDLWPLAIEETKNGKENEPALITVNETTYMALFYDDTLGFKRHRIWALMREDNLNDAPNYDVTLNLVMELVALCVLFVLVLAFLRWNDKHKRKRRNKRIKAISGTVGREVADFGPIGQAIWVIRKYELVKPEQTRISKILDHAILSAARPCARLLNRDGDAALNKHPECGFCPHLLRDRSEAQVKEDPPYETWEALTVDHVNIGEVSFEHFEYDHCVKHAPRFLAKFFVGVVREQGLFFSQLDPDGLIQFTLGFASEYCTDPVETAIELFALHRLLTCKFVSWIPEKLYMFCMYFAVLVKHMNVDRLVTLFDDIETEFSVLTDPKNRYDMKCELLFAYLHDFVADVFTASPDPVVQKFCCVVKELLDICEFGKHFEVLGQLRVAVEASDFSCSDSDEDLCVFMKALFAFVSFAPYWIVDHGHFDKHFDTFCCDVFSPSEWEDKSFVASYHWEVVTNVVSVWVSVFSNFVDLGDIKKALNATTAYFNDWIERKPDTGSSKLFEEGRNDDFEDSPIIEKIEE